MRLSLALTGLVVSLVLFFLYSDLVPALTHPPLPIQKPSYQLGSAKSYSEYEESPHRPLHLVFNDESSSIVTARGGGVIEEWEIESRSQRNVLHTNHLFSYLSPKHSIVTKDVVGNVGLLALDTKQLSPIARDFYIHSAIDRKGTLLVLSTGEKSLEIWKVGKMALSQRVDTSMPVRNGVAISQDGHYLAAAEGTYDSAANFHHTAIQVWNFKKKVPHFLFNGEHEGEAHGVWQISFSPDASLLATDSKVDSESGMTVWDIQSGERMFEVRGFDSYWVRALSFSSDGQYLATGDELGNLIIWSLSTHNKVWETNVDGQVIHSIAFSPDDQLLAAGIQDSTIQVWDIQLPAKT